MSSADAHICGVWGRIHLAEFIPEWEKYISCLQGCQRYSTANSSLPRNTVTNTDKPKLLGYFALKQRELWIAILLQYLGLLGDGEWLEGENTGLGIVIASALKISFSDKRQLPQTWCPSVSKCMSVPAAAPVLCTPSMGKPSPRELWGEKNPPLDWDFSSKLFKFSTKRAVKGSRLSSSQGLLMPHSNKMLCRLSKLQVKLLCFH